MKRFDPNFLLFLFIESDKILEFWQRRCFGIFFLLLRRFYCSQFTVNLIRLFLLMLISWSMHIRFNAISTVWKIILSSSQSYSVWVFFILNSYWLSCSVETTNIVNRNISKKYSYFSCWKENCDAICKRQKEVQRNENLRNKLYAHFEHDHIISLSLLISVLRIFFNFWTWFSYRPSHLF